MITFIGDSHLRALSRGYWRLSEDERASVKSRLGRVQFAITGPATAFSEPFFAAKDDGLAFFEPMASRLARALGDPEAADTVPVQGRHYIVSMGFQPGVIHRTGMLDKWTSGTHRTGKLHISRAAYRETVLAFNRPALDFFDALKAAGARVSALSAPPPGASFGVVERFGDTAIDLWHENHRIMTEEMSRRGIEVLEPPEIVCKEGGGPRLLRDVLCDNEVANSAHGNPWYGEIFLRDIFTGVGVDGVAGDARLRSELNSPDAELEREVQLGFALANRRGDAAPIFLKAMQRHPRDRRLLYGLGYALERKNRLLDAEACYLDLAEVAPDWDEAWFAIARVRWQRVPDTRCLEAIEKARSLGCERPSARLLHGAILEKLSRRQAARAVLREVLFEPGTGKLKPEWAGLLEPSDPQETGFFELKADPERDSYLRALEQVPSIAPYLAVLARLELELGNKGAGGHAIRLALKISPERQEWHSILADIIMAQEDWKLAAHHYRIASAAAPKIARYALALGSALEKSGDPKDARAVYLTAARDHPNDSRFTAALHRITSGVAPHPPKPKEAQKQPPPQRTESENLEWRQRLSSTWIVKQAGRARRFLKRRLGLSP